MAEQQCSGLAIQRVIRIRVSEQLGKEDFEDVDHIYGHIRLCILEQWDGHQTWVTTSGL